MAMAPITAIVISRFMSGRRRRKASQALGSDRDESGGDSDGVEKTRDDRNRLLAAQTFTAERRADVAGEERVGEEAGGGRRAGEDGQDQAPPSQTVAAAVAGVTALDLPGLGREARLAHRGKDGRVWNLKPVGVDGHPAAQQVEAEACLAADDRSELSTQGGNFLRAVHSSDAERPRRLRAHPRPPQRFRTVSSPRRAGGAGKVDLATNRRTCG